MRSLWKMERHRESPTANMTIEKIILGCGCSIEEADGDWNTTKMNLCNTHQTTLFSRVLTLAKNQKDPNFERAYQLWAGKAYPESLLMRGKDAAS